MEKLKDGKRKLPIGLLLFILISIGSMGSSFAEEQKRGSEVIVLTMGGDTIRGELLAVKNDEIILMDSLNLSGITLKINEIQKITIVKKNGLFKGMGLGLLIGGGSGALLGLASGDDEPGFLSFTAGEKAAIGGLGFGILGALSGGILGILKGIDESVIMESRSPNEMDRILHKLNLKSRSQQTAAQIYPDILPDHTLKSRETKSAKEENRQRNNDSLGTNDSGKSTRPKFSRFHISFKPGYFSSQGTKKTINFFENIGFGDTEPGGELMFLWFSFGSYGPTDYPRITERPGISLADIRVDYSLNRNLALGIEYAPMGKHSVCGYKKMLVYGEGTTYYSNLFLKEKYSGETFVISASWMPIPDPFLGKGAIKLGISAGISNIKFNYETSKWEYSESEGENIEMSKKNLVLAGFAEIDHYFNKYMSLGASAEYRYIPVRIKATQITGYYDDVDDNMNLINSSMLIDIPEHNMNLGGFRVGVNIGFHF